MGIFPLSNTCSGFRLQFYILGARETESSKDGYLVNSFDVSLAIRHYGLVYDAHHQRRALVL